MNPTTYFYWHRVGRLVNDSYSLIFRVTCKGDYNYGKYLSEWLVSATKYSGYFRLGVAKLGGNEGAPQLSVCIDTSGYVWIQAYIMWNCSKTVELVTSYGTDIELTRGSYGAWATPAGFTKSVQVTNEGQTN